VLFRWSNGIRNIPLNKLAPGIEIKGEGGYIIIAPGQMSDGKKYIAECDVLPADPPQWLLDKIDAYYFE
jgi:hypothetical protein